MSERPETDVLAGRGRFVAVLACLAVLAQGFLLPGTRAFGSGKILTALEYASPILLTSSALFAWVFSVRAAYSLAFPSALSVAMRTALGAFAIAGLSISLPAFRGHGAPFMLLIIQCTGSLACIAAGAGALGARSRTSTVSRPFAFALFAVGGASLLRCLAHFLTYGVEFAQDPTLHPHWHVWARALASVANVLEAALQVMSCLVIARIVTLMPVRHERFSPAHVIVAVVGGGIAAAFTLLSLEGKTNALYTFLGVALQDAESGALPSIAPAAVRFLAIWSPILALSLVVTGFRKPEFALLGLLCLSRGSLDVPAFYYFAMLGMFGVALTVGRRPESSEAAPRPVEAPSPSFTPDSGPRGPLH